MSLLRRKAPGAADPDFQIIRSDRRTVSIEVHPDLSVRVRAPRRLSRQQIQRLVDSRREWIAARRAEQAARPRPQPRSWRNGSRHRVLGEWYTIVQRDLLDTQRADPPSASSTGETSSSTALQIRINHLLRTIETPEAHLQADSSVMERQLHSALRREALPLFQARMEHWLPAIQDWPQQPRQLRVRLMRRTWGSCTHDGRITLNVRAFQLPLDLIDYILAHELCHLREMNHSRRFHALQRQLVPDYLDRRRRLRSLESEILGE